MKNVHFARRVRRALMAAALGSGLVLSGCSQPQEDGQAAETVPAEAAADAAASDATDVPGAGTTATSGVAFAYSLAFRLADDSIADAQDRHVRACDALGRTRCQVDSIGYEREGDGPARAHLHLRLDPVLARSFARDAGDIVRRLDGELTHSSVSGEDMDGRIDASQQNSAVLGGDLDRLEQRLARPGLSSREQAELQRQVEQLRGTLRDEETSRRGDEARLAATPLRLDYVGNSSPAGISSDRPFASAWAASVASLGAASSFLLMLIGVLLPWLLIGGSGVVLWRWLRRKTRRTAAQPASGEQP